MIIGAHVSVAGGLVKALDYAGSVGCECIQIFAKSPRQWRGPSMDLDRAEEFIRERKSRSFGPVFTHTAYLINLSTSDDELRAKSVLALADELIRASILGADGVVTHVGNDRDGDASMAAGRAGASIRDAFEIADRVASPPRLLLENTAGAGASFGGDFAELAECQRHAGIEYTRLGICIDTCHAFAKGFALDTAEGWQECLDLVDATCGISSIGLVHANDCMFERGSKRDRHAWIGDGFIGMEGFAAMMCMPQLRDIPLVTEMPGETPQKDSVNNERLRALRDGCGPSHEGASGSK